MTGDDRVRHCDQCNLNVYNFAELTRAEIEELVATREGSLCARLYKRADGTLITKDCPVGFHIRVRRISRIAGAALSVGMVAVPMVAQTPPTSQPSSVTIRKSGIIGIEVVDQTGARIPRANVRLTNATTNIRTETPTDAIGMLRLPDLAPGNYRIVVQSLGFTTSERSVTLSAGEALDLQIRVEIGEVLQGGPMFATNSYLETTELPLSTERIPDIAVTPNTPPSPAPQTWFEKLRRKLRRR